MDVGGAEVERLALAERACDRRTTQCEAVLGDLALHDRDRPAGQVVVVEARVLFVHPTDQPHRDVVVAAQLLVVPLVGRVLHEVLPHRRVGGEVADEGLQGGAVELIHTKRSGLVTKMACSAAAPSAASATGSITGRSEPYRRRSTPTTRSIASMAFGP